MHEKPLQLPENSKDIRKNRFAFDATFDKKGNEDINEIESGYELLT